MNSSHTNPDASTPSDTDSNAESNAQQIEQLIPHRPPMRLVDEIVSQDDKSIVCRKTFAASEFFLQGHFPGHPIVPGVIQCECCLQAGAILLSKQSQQAEESLPVATRLDSVRFKRMVRPGDTVEIQVTLNEQVSNAFYLTGKMTLDGKLTTRLDFACSMTQPLPENDANEEAGA